MPPTFLGIGVCQHPEVFALITKDVCRSTLAVSGRQLQGRALAKPGSQGALRTPAHQRSVPLQRMGGP